ncbi:3-dehydroquinate synthase [Idiomarina seosinensis]|uniref:3-dehydroquinate synthase n=1 Tax=Idiomarina seosinensis TaxID=281739 RepID=UPI00384C3952
MTSITVELNERSYPIHITSGSLGQFNKFLPKHNQQLCIITNPTVAQYYLQPLLDSLTEFSVTVFEMPDGEQYKSLSIYSDVMDHLIAAGLNRDCAIVALGGGVVGDMAGFVAATFQRGVDFYQIPTTLLAQVDSSVGGKTAVNHSQGKNLIGAFYQPKAVLIDAQCLQTLTERDYLSGLAEVIKYGIIYDAEFFSWLEHHTAELKMRDANTLMSAIQRSCEIKALIVADDEREQGVRALLNLGHTFGHAIEAASHYGEWTHGEAVAAGTIIASKLAEVTQQLSVSEFRRLFNLFSALGLPTQSPDMPWSEWRDYMQRDKKVKDGKLHFILPTGIGSAAVFKDIDEQTIAAVITECC